MESLLLLFDGLSNLQKGFLTVFMILIVWTLVRKLSGKTLRLPPGPPAVPIFGNWLQVGDDLNHRNLSDMAKKYGEIFMLKMGQRNLIVVSSPELAKEVLHTQGMEFGSRPRSVVFDIFSGKGQDMIFTDYGEHWRKMKRIMSVPFFSNKVVQQHNLAWQREIDEAIDDIRNNPESSSTGIVLRKRMQLMMYNIVYKMMFDHRFESYDDPLFQRLLWLSGQRSRLAQSFEYNYGDFIPVLQPFLRKYLRGCKDVNDQGNQLFKEAFVDPRKKLLSKGCTSPCGIDLVLEAEAKGEINIDNVLYIIQNVNLAAIETTLWSMEWTIAEIINHKDVQKKIHEELDDVIGPGNPLTEQDTVKLKYLQAVIKEAMRMHMPVPLLLPHMNLKHAKLGGYDIPPECKVLVNTWYLANNPEWWENPEEFKPERFLGDEVIEASGNDLRYLPFGIGRRSCPGIVVAMPILGMVIGKLLQSFELSPPPGQSKIDTTENGGQFSLRILNHFSLVAKPRP